MGQDFTEKSSGENPFVSIVIPTCRDEQTLNKCLFSLLNQDYPKDRYEIILVSKNKLNLNIGASGKDKIKVICGVDYANSRNIGVAEARGELVAFIDDDCQVEKEWISRAVPYFKDEKVALIGGPAVPPKSKEFNYRVGGYLMASYFATGFGSCRYGVASDVYEAEEYSLLTANNFLRKDVFKKVGGFDTNQVPSEENDLYFRIKKIGYKLLYVPEISVWHSSKPIFLPLAGKIFFYATGRGLLMARKPETIRFLYLIPPIFTVTLLGLFALSFFSEPIFYFLTWFLALYLLWNTANAFYIFFKFEKNPLVFLSSFPATFLIHISYGSGVFKGLYKFISLARNGKTGTKNKN